MQTPAAASPLDQPLALLMSGPPLALPATAPLGEALRRMHERDVGSVLVVDAQGLLCGIFTRHDLLGRVMLPGRPLQAPLGEVMSAPVHGLSGSHTGHDAALLMAQHGLRHVPVTEAGRPLGMVSEHYLFARERLSLARVGATLDRAADLPALQLAAAEIRRSVRQLQQQGVSTRQLTEIISGLNDRLVGRCFAWALQGHGLAADRACWLAFGSEGRAEQTLVTDQDNGIVFADDAPPEEAARWRALGRAVNEALAACGWPLCRGGVMAGEAACCHSVEGWQQRFTHWITHGAPQDLMHAAIFFDLRPVAGQPALAAPLRAHITAQARANPRFLMQMAAQALQHRPPLHWLGGLATLAREGHALLDLKLQGTALFVEAARVLALAAGVPATGTRERLLALPAAGALPPQEAAACVTAFGHLQALRLRLQLAAGEGAADANRCVVDGLDPLEQRMLRDALAVARPLQQRLALDFGR